VYRIDGPTPFHGSLLCRDNTRVHPTREWVNSSRYFWSNCTPLLIIDPVVFFKLQLVMFFEDIRSERLLLRQVADRLSVRWYVGYNLDEPLPDHSTLSKIRLRYGLSVFRRFFEAIVEQCHQAKGCVAKNRKKRNGV